MNMFTIVLRISLQTEVKIEWQEKMIKGTSESDFLFWEEKTLVSNLQNLTEFKWKVS